MHTVIYALCLAITAMCIFITLNTCEMRQTLNRIEATGALKR